MKGDAAETALQEIDWDTATPEQAYAEARRRIAEAKVSCAAKLELEKPTALKTLKALPPEIGDLSELRELHIGDMDVEDLAPLVGLSRLHKLTICRLPVTDLSPLSFLKGLNYLWLTQLPASNLAPLVGLHSLEMLSLLYGIPVSDLTPVGNIKSLRRISLEDCREITDISPLAKLTQLTVLFCANTKISNLAPLAGLSALQLLDLHNTPVADIEPLAGLTELADLNLWQTQVSDLAPLARLYKLTTLSLGHNKLVSDIKPLARLTALKTLNLDYTSVADLSAVAEFTRMMDQWTDKSDPDYEEYDDYGDYDDYDDPYNEDRRGLHYDETPVALREPYCWLARLPSRRRTVETINVVRRGKQLPPYHPEGYEPPEEAEGSGSETKEIIDRVRGHMERLEQTVRAREKSEGWWETIRKGALFGLGSLLVTGAAYGVCLIVKANEAAVRSWIDQLGGSQTLHWIVDLMVKMVPSIG